MTNIEFWSLPYTAGPLRSSVNFLLRNCFEAVRGVANIDAGLATNSERFACGMNLWSVKRELEHLKALAFSQRTSFCVCEFVEVINGQTLATEQEQILENNRACYERQSDNREVHVGWSWNAVPHVETSI